MARSASKLQTAINGLKAACMIRRSRAAFLLESAPSSPVLGNCGTRGLSVFSASLGNQHIPSFELNSDDKRGNYSKSKRSLKRNYHRQLVQYAEVLQEKNRTVQCIKNNVVYNNDGIVAINKPPGLRVSETGTPGDNLPSSSRSVSVSSLMPEIADMTGKPAAEIASGIEKETSGMLLLGENKMAAEELKSKLVEARKKRQFVRTYRTIACGIPEEKEGVMKSYMEYDVINDTQMTVVRPDPSQKQIKRGQVFSAETLYRVISENKELGCSLMELKPLRVRRHQLRAQLTSLLCPALGDHLYSHQVRTVLGVPMLMDPYGVPPSRTVQVLNPAVRKALELTNRQASLLPLFLHLHRVSLPGWRGRRDLGVVAPHPAHFRRALRVLGLEVEEEEEEGDCPIKLIDHRR